MTPDQIKALRVQLGVTQQGLADRINDLDPFFRASRQTVYKWESGNRSPDRRSTDVLARLWLHEGYPVTVTMYDGSQRPGTLTTNHAASSYGQPVIVIDGVAQGMSDVTVADIDGVPDAVRDRWDK